MELDAMNLADAIYNRFFVRGFLINSLPKSGTNLVKKAMGLFPGIHSSGIHLGRQSRRGDNRFTKAIASLGVLPVDRCIKRMSLDPNDSEVLIPIGVVWPRPVPFSAAQCILRRVGRGSYVTAHIPFSRELAADLAESGMKMLLVLRDPRDVVVSQAKYIAETPAHWLFDYYRALSEKERIRVSIVGVREATPHGGGSLSIYDRLKGTLPWIQEPFTHATYFEKLVGPRGGGSREDQLKELGNIVSHLAIRCSQKKVQEIAESLFGGTSTFRRGAIGSWRSCFTEEHKRLFKEMAGQLLIDMEYEGDYDW
jgi:hypothetical protein